MRLFSLIFLSLVLAATPAMAADKSYPYGGFLPDDYSANPDLEYPLVLFLHGAGDTNWQEAMLPKFAKTQKDFPFIIIVPRASHDWQPDRLDALLKEVTEKYRVDRKRIYLTGLSMGGFGTWRMATAYPDWFAAVAMFAGGGDPGKACALKKVPIWIVHNRDDDIVSYRGSEELAKAVQACHGNVTLTINDKLEPGQWKHEAWHGVYTSPGLYDWFLRYKKD